MTAASGFLAARRDPALVVLEGVHALKHAVRFGATVERIASPEPAALVALLGTLAPDVVLPVDVERLSPSDWSAATRGGLPSPGIAIARRPGARDVLGADDGRPVVLLDDPRHLGNVGATIRVAAAADAAGVVVLGEADPWHPTAVRAAAGLQFAIAVERRTSLPLGPRPLVALDPEGVPIADVDLPAGSILAFGTERHGLSAAVRDAAEHLVSLPMRAGVSSLNLATAVAATLYRR